MSDLTLQRRRSGAISGSERITGVKNAQADVLLKKKNLHYDLLLKKKEEEIQIEEYRLHNENKVLNMENMKNELEYKKRLYPDADLSNDEMTVANLQKYLVRNANKLCYTDKSLSNKVRHRASTDSIPPIVAEARSVLVKKEVVRAVEKNRQHMYSFMKKSASSRQDTKPPTQQKRDNFDEFEKILEENKLPSFSGQTEAKGRGEGDQHARVKYQTQQYLSLPGVTTATGDNQTAEPTKTLKRSELQRRTKSLVIRDSQAQQSNEVQEMIRQNPLLRDAIEAQQREKMQLAKDQASHSVEGVLSRMARKKPPSKSQMQEELENVQMQVQAFCTNVEQALWAYKQEEFQQSLRFVKDKDAEWNRFMEKMQKRNRMIGGEREESFPPTPVEVKKRPKTTTVSHRPLTEKQKQRILMENMLVSKPARETESAPTRRRGKPCHFLPSPSSLFTNPTLLPHQSAEKSLVPVNTVRLHLSHRASRFIGRRVTFTAGVPYHTANRSQHHSPTAKLQRMLERNRSVLDQVTGSGSHKDGADAVAVNSSFAAATKQAALQAL